MGSINIYIKFCNNEYNRTMKTKFDRKSQYYGNNNVINMQIRIFLFLNLNKSKIYTYSFPCVIHI